MWSSQESRQNVSTKTPSFEAVFVDAPIESAITPALARQLRHRREKCRAIGRGERVFDGDQHRTSVGLDVL
jgi:hypothetical protein